MTKEELETLVKAIHVLHKQYGGTEWAVSIGSVSYYDPKDFKPFKPIYVNGSRVGQFDVEVD